MAFYFVQFLTGLASDAASLFLVASGLSIIFGVTRIVNFAHGAFYMLGAYVAFTLIPSDFPARSDFWGGIFAAALIVAAVGVPGRDGAAAADLVMRHELFQLLATVRPHFDGRGSRGY